MLDQNEMYFQLFNKLTDIIEELKEMQCQMEEMYIGQNEVANPEED